VRDTLTSTATTLSDQVQALNRGSEVFRDELGEVRNATTDVDRRLQLLASNVEVAAGKTDETFSQISRAYERQRDQTIDLRTDVGKLGDRATELTANLTRMLVFAAENKAEILELRVADSGLEGKLDRLGEAHSAANAGHVEIAAGAARNITRLGGRADNVEKDLRQLVDRFRSLESLFSGFAQSSGELRTEVASLRANHQDTRSGLENVKYDK